MAELTAKNTILTSAVKIANEMTERIAANEEKKSGLCIRSVNKYIYMHIYILYKYINIYVSCIYMSVYKQIPRYTTPVLRYILILSVFKNGYFFFM
jgi:hypothetical protein